ncbi:MAG: RtcB family protein [Clostridia bacterium]|nr:RtcB family protein [Clostridia bacterium]
MIEIKGRYNSALCYTDFVDQGAQALITRLCNEPAFADSKIRIMPDVHAGVGACVGTTMTIGERVSPSMVGVDIGCGMETLHLGKGDIDLEAVNKAIIKHVPYGKGARKEMHPYNKKIDLTKLYCFDKIDHLKAQLTLGTLGGGNHFIEIDVDDDGEKYLVVHSGSRNLGRDVAEYYKTLAYETMKHSGGADTPLDKALAYLEGENLRMYLHDMKIVQEFSVLNRQAIIETIVRVAGLPRQESFSTIHNYIDTDSMILRKGAVAANKGQMLLIPLNMRDGSLICIGKGNEEWNYSAPHGAGRLLSRTSAKEQLSLEEYKREMAGIFTTCVSEFTLDESPMAYKPMAEILAHISPTVEIVKRIKPIFNFKA